MPRMSVRPRIAALLALLLAPGAVRANSGDLDPTFGTGGKVTTSFGLQDVANAVLVQPDGKVVAAGFTANQLNYDFALARYNGNGSLDTTFGTGGKVTTPIGSLVDDARALARQPDGKLVAAGYTSNGGLGSGDFALVRYNADGSLDTTFGTGGKVTTPIGSETDVALAVVVQPDGKIVAAGRASFGPGSDSDVALARYDSNGSLDATFGTGGIVMTSIGIDHDEAEALVLQSDGKLVAAGKTFDPSVGTDIALLRYNTDGSLDTTFGTGGIVTTSIDTSDEATALVVQPDGKLVVAGGTSGVGSPDFILARYDATGSLDGSFGTGGTVRTPIGCCGEYASALVLQADGKLVAAGSAGSGTDFALARYMPNGSLDATFGTGGVVTTSFGGEDYPFALAIQADGKLVAAGTTGNGFSGVDSRDFALARYQNDVCGDGIVQSAEQCDDGNRADGDCCSSSCRRDADGTTCSDGNVCTDGDVCHAGACRGVCQPGKVCSAAGEPAKQCGQTAGCDPKCLCQPVP